LNIQVGTKNSNKGYVQEGVDRIIRGTCHLRTVMETKMRTAVKWCWIAVSQMSHLGSLKVV